MATGSANQAIASIAPPNGRSGRAAFAVTTISYLKSSPSRHWPPTSGVLNVGTGPPWKLTARPMCSRWSQPALHGPFRSPSGRPSASGHPPRPQRGRAQSPTAGSMPTGCLAVTWATWLELVSLSEDWMVWRPPHSGAEIMPCISQGLTETGKRMAFVAVTIFGVKPRCATGSRRS